MKAYVLHGVGDLRYEDTAMPVLPDGWALVRILACGICSSDLPRIFETGTYHFPAIPGHEFCGRVIKVASQQDSGLIGKYVGVFPLIPCKRCEPCQKGEYQLCDNYNYLGSRCDGGFAEYAAVPVWNLLPLLEGVPPEHYALLESAAVSLHAVKRAQIPAGASVCVIGSGAIGLLAAQWAKAYGAESIYVLGLSGRKAAIANAVGAEYRLNTNKSYDTVFETIGAGETLSKAIDLLKPGGTLILLGNPKASIQLEKNNYWKILRKELTVKGSWNSRYESGQLSDWDEAAKALAGNKLNAASLITHIAPQGELLNYLNMMRLNQEVHCKVVLRFSSPAFIESSI